MKTENTPEVGEIKDGEIVTLHTRFGDMSRGRCWGKCFAGKAAPVGDFKWVDKSGGTLYLTEPGYYIVGSSDGFRREARSEFYLAAAAVGQTKDQEYDNR